MKRITFIVALYLFGFVVSGCDTSYGGAGESAENGENVAEQKLSPKSEYLRYMIMEKDAYHYLAILSYQTMFGINQEAVDKALALDLLEQGYIREDADDEHMFWMEPGHILAAYYYMTLQGEIEMRPFMADAYNMFQNISMATGMTYCSALREGKKDAASADKCLDDLVTANGPGLNVATYAMFSSYGVSPSINGASRAVATAANSTVGLGRQEMLRPVIAHLLERGLDLTATTGWGATALDGAVGFGDYELATMLLQAGAPLDIGKGKDQLFVNALRQLDDSDRPWRISQINGFLTSMIKAGADVNGVRGPLGLTPLMIAAASGHESSVRLLMDHGADPNLQLVVGEEETSKSAVDVAADNQMFHLESVFDEYGVDTTGVFSRARERAIAAQKAEDVRMAEARRVASTHPFVAVVDCYVGGTPSYLHGCTGERGSITVRDQFASKSYRTNDLFWLQKSSMDIPLSEQFSLVIQNGENRFSDIRVRIKDVVSGEYLFDDHTEGPFDTISVEN